LTPAIIMMINSPLSTTPNFIILKTWVIRFTRATAPPATMAPGAMAAGCLAVRAGRQEQPVAGVRAQSLANHEPQLARFAMGTDAILTALAGV
jgi:hypothetical protein